MEYYLFSFFYSATIVNLATAESPINEIGGKNFKLYFINAYIVNYSLKYDMVGLQYNTLLL